MPRKQTASGSPEGEPEYLVVGYLRRPHGVHGEIMMDVHTDFPERLRIGRRLFVGEKHISVHLADKRPHQSGMLVKFKDVENPEEAGRFRNQWIYIRTSEVPALPRGQLYQHQLFGLKVLGENDILLGQLVEIIDTGANDVYVIKNESGRELLIPAITSVIQEIDLDRRIMRVHPPEEE